MCGLARSDSVWFTVRTLFKSFNFSLHLIVASVIYIPLDELNLRHSNLMLISWCNQPSNIPTICSPFKSHPSFIVGGSSELSREKLQIFLLYSDDVIIIKTYRARSSSEKKYIYFSTLILDRPTDESAQKEFTCVNFPPSRPWKRTKNKKQSKSFQLFFSWSSTQNRLELLQWLICNFPNFRVERSRKKECRFSFIIRPVHTTVAESSVGWTTNELLQIFNFCFPPISIHFTFSSKKKPKKLNIGKSSNFSLSKWENITFEGRRRRRLDFTQATWTIVSTEVARNDGEKIVPFEEPCFCSSEQHCCCCYWGQRVIERRVNFLSK